jgi:hypothetical protein
MINDRSNFLLCGPNKHNLLFGVALDTWEKWWAVALYTFFSTSSGKANGAWYILSTFLAMFLPVL